MAALRQVADGSCVAKSTVRDIETHKCYEVVGTPIARADDVQMARVDDDESCWCIDLTLNDSAAARLDRLIRTAPATEVMAIRFGSTAIAFPRPPGPLGGTMSINGENWTQVDAQRVVDALSGPKTAHDYPGITIPPNLLLPPTSSTVPPGP